MKAQGTGLPNKGQTSKLKLITGAQIYRNLNPSHMFMLLANRLYRHNQVRHHTHCHFAAGFRPPTKHL